jgi:hypothetical protein
MGLSKRSAQRKMRAIKEHFEKDLHQTVTVEEFCFYTGLDRSVVDDHFRAIGEREYFRRGD